MILEVKHAGKEREIPGKMREALRQFADKRYLEGAEKGFRIRIGYGVVFCGKDCVLAKVE